MLEITRTSLIWFLAVGSGVMAGVYFTFSTFVMRSLAALPPEAGGGAMQSINAVIVRSPFLPLFFATTIAAAGAVAFALADWSGPRSAALLAAGVVYVLGMFVSTVALNVPLNDTLAAADLTSPEGQAFWSRYLDVWTSRNHIRTAACVLACALFIVALEPG